MSYKLVYIDFPIEGPWGAEMAEAYQELAQDIKNEPGLLWKVWTESKERGEQGGVYLFQDEESANRYLTKHLARLKSFGIKDIRVKVFDVNEPLSRINQAKLG